MLSTPQILIFFYEHISVTLTIVLQWLTLETKAYNRKYNYDYLNETVINIVNTDKIPTKLLISKNE